MYVYNLDLLGVVKLANLNSYLLILASSQLKICHLHRRKMLIVYSKFSTLSKLSYRWIHMKLICILLKGVLSYL